jgi:hypothetical protein
MVVLHLLKAGIVAGCAAVGSSCSLTTQQIITPDVTASDRDA